MISTLFIFVSLCLLIEGCVSYEKIRLRKFLYLALSSNMQKNSLSDLSP